MAGIPLPLLSVSRDDSFTIRDGAELVASFRAALEAAGFVTAKGEVKLMLTEAVTREQIDAVLKILGDIERGVRENGLVGVDMGDRE